MLASVLRRYVGEFHRWACEDRAWEGRPVPSGHAGPVADVAWHKDGVCVSVSADQTARVLAPKGAHRDYFEVARCARVKGVGGWGGRMAVHRRRRGGPEDGGVGAAKTVKRPPQPPAQPPIRQLLGAADTQTAYPATSSTAPAHQPLGSGHGESSRSPEEVGFSTSGGGGGVREQGSIDRTINQLL